MHRYYLIRLLLTPSIVSGALCVILAGAVAGVTAWSFIGERQLFYDYLFGVYGFNTLLVQDGDSLQVLSQAISGSNFTYYTLILLCSLLVGVLVYALAEGVRIAAQQTSVAWRQLHSTGSAYSRAAHQNLARLVVRIAALASWALYTTVFASVLLPAALVLTRAGTENIDFAMAWGWVQIAESFILLAICLHVHVVFARLTMLRSRIFGGADARIAGYHQPVPGSEGLHVDERIEDMAKRFAETDLPSLFPNRDQEARHRTDGSDTSAPGSADRRRS